MNLVRAVLLMILDEVRRDDVGFVDQAVAEGAFFSEVVLQRVKDDAVQLDRLGVPVVWVGFDFDVSLDAPGLQFERAVSDVVARALPLGEAFGRRSP